MLDECLEFLENRKKNSKSFLYEVIIVSDGSKDKTVKVASEYSVKYGSDIVRVLDLQPNRGKGGAVRLVSILLFLDYVLTKIITIIYFSNVTPISFL